jgi:uncharacterized protein
MDIAEILLIVLGLCLFEAISSIDNAVINAEVLHSMSQKARKWFLSWGMLFAIFIVRGLLPLVIVWMAAPSLGAWGALTATFNNDPRALEAIETASPLLLMAGGIFLVFLFFNWLFQEEKTYGLPGEHFFHSHSVWFYAVVSLLLTSIVWLALQKDPLLAFAASIGSSLFFITHGFKQNAEMQEKQLMKKGKSDLAKLFYLEAIDATFSIDGVLGAFAFTLAVPLILIGSGLGAIVLRQLTMHNIERVKKYIYLKNGAMYSIFFLGSIMLLDSFGVSIPSIISPLITFIIIGYFFFKSKMAISKN